MSKLNMTKNHFLQLYAVIILASCIVCWGIGYKCGKYTTVIKLDLPKGIVTNITNTAVISVKTNLPVIYTPTRIIKRSDGVYWVERYYVDTWEQSLFTSYYTNIVDARFEIVRYRILDEEHARRLSLTTEVVE